MQIVKNTLIAVLVAVLAQSAAALETTPTGRIINTCTQPNMMAMCWDDGPSTYSASLLQSLRSEGIKATFHVTTLHLLDPNVRSVLKQMAADGHLIGLRTEAKWNLMGMSDEKIKSGLVRQAQVLAKIIGYTPRFVRLPYGGFDDRVLRAVQSTGLIVTSHSLDPQDYSNNRAKIVDTYRLALELAVDNRPHISVQHDGIQDSVAAVPEIKKIVQAYKYRFVTLDECLGMSNMREFNESLVGGDDPIDFAEMGGDNIPPPATEGRIPTVSPQSSAAMASAGKTLALAAGLSAFALALF